MVGGDWLNQAKPEIEARMAQYEEGQIEFAILSLVQDPRVTLVQALAENVKSLSALSARLDVVKPDWQDFITSSKDGGAITYDDVLSGVDLNYSLTLQDLNHAKLPDKVVDLCLSNVTQDIVAHRQQLITTQAALRMSIKEELQLNVSDEERAAARSCDYGAMMQSFVRKLKAKKRLQLAAQAAQA